MPYGMKSVVVIGPDDSDEQAFNKFKSWYEGNQSAVVDKYVPNAQQTREYLLKASGK